MESGISTTNPSANIEPNADHQPPSLLETNEDKNTGNPCNTFEPSGENQLRQAQRMESIGQLARGIAHDFNNLIAVIDGYARLILAKGDPSPQIAKPVSEILKAAERAAELTRQLLAFSRKQVLNMQPGDLAAIVQKIVPTLQYILGKNISLKIDFPAGLSAVQVDAAAIEKVLVNLAFNSRDAIAESGTVRITGSAIESDDEYIQQNPQASAGSFVCLTFSDDGCGILPENLPRIFEPFFTTKELDRGTGLSLATVYGIIKQHRGWVKATSEVGRGTTLNVFLPVAQKTAPAPFAAEKGTFAKKAAPPLEPRIIGGTETLLIVEEEEPLRKLMAHVLQNHGYKVLSAASAGEALKIWTAQKSAIDLLLTELNLNGEMHGSQLAAALRKSKLDLKVIYTSSQPEEKLGREFNLPSNETVIQKPFHTRAMAEMVYQSLKR